MTGTMPARQRAGDVEGRQRRRRVRRQRCDAVPFAHAQDEARDGDAQHPDERGSRHAARRQRHDAAEAQQGQTGPPRRPGEPARKHTRTAAAKGENRHRGQRAMTACIRPVFVSCTWRSNSLDCVRGRNPLVSQKKLQSTFAVRQYIDTRRVHQFRCAFYLALHFQNMVRYRTLAHRFRKGRTSAPPAPAAATGGPHAGSPTRMICGLIRSNGRNADPRIILDLVRPQACRLPMALATPSGFRRSLHEDQPRVAPR